MADITKIATRIKEVLDASDKKIEAARIKCDAEIANNFQSAFNKHIKEDKKFIYNVKKNLEDGKEAATISFRVPLGKFCEEYNQLCFRMGEGEWGKFRDGLNKRIFYDGNASWVTTNVERAEDQIIYSVTLAFKNYF